MQLFAPAKINLSFEIVRRREDGFHEIVTLMTPISLGDDLIIETENANPGLAFTCDDPTIPTGGDNLVVRAAELFFKTANRSPQAKLFLRKRVPHGAGLGGGSSDAAATLLGLNTICGAGFSLPRLAELAAGIGSDVPFFIYESAAVCRGRGEIVEPVSSAPKLPLLLLKPSFGVPTPWAYRQWRTAREIPGVAYGPQHFGGITFFNQLERPVFEKYVFLAHMKTWLLARPEVEVALMSGSGSTMFAVLRDACTAPTLADRAKAELDPDLWTCACATTQPANQSLVLD